MMSERVGMMAQGDTGPHEVAIREVPSEGTGDAEAKVFEAGVGEIAPDSDAETEEPNS